MVAVVAAVVAAAAVSTINAQRAAQGGPEHLDFEAYGRSLRRPRGAILPAEARLPV